MVVMVTYTSVLALVSMATVGVGAAPGTTQHLEEIFVGRCYDYQMFRKPSLLKGVPASCPHLYHLFSNSFANKTSCGLANDSYTPFFDAAYQETPPGKALFWSGTYASVQLVSQRGQRYVSMEDTLIGHLADRHSFCGNTSTLDGFDDQSCPGWDACEGESSETFWKTASRLFAKEARGDVHVLLTGTNPNKKAYRKDSVFSMCELPNLNISHVSKVIVMLANALGVNQRETCTTGTLVDLRHDVEARGLAFQCEENPPTVLHLLCSDQPGHVECQKVNNMTAQPQDNLHGLVLVFFTLQTLADTLAKW